MSGFEAPYVRKTVSLPHSLWRRIEDYQFGCRIKRDAEAVRRLIELGLQAAAGATSPSAAQPKLLPQAQLQSVEADNNSGAPFPWQQPQARDDAFQQLNARISERPSLAIEWLARCAKTSKQELVRRALNVHVAEELRKSGADTEFSPPFPPLRIVAEEPHGGSGYPWQRAYVRDDAMVSLNVKIPERLMMAIDWLVYTKKAAKRTIVETAIRRLLEGELRRLGLTL